MRLYFDNGINKNGSRTIKLFAVEENEWLDEIKNN